MNYRILLMASGLMMMFAVFAAIMWLGSFLQEAEGAPKNLLLTSILTVLMLAIFAFAMHKRKQARAAINQEVSSMFGSIGHIMASDFATRLNVSLDDARDILDDLMRTKGWHREELPQYDARYFV